MVSSFDKYDAEFKALRQLVARKHEHFPEFSLAECVTAALNELYDPANEPDPAFRRWLLERQVSLEGPPDVRDANQ